MSLNRKIPLATWGVQAPEVLGVVGSGSAAGICVRIEASVERPDAIHHERQPALALPRADVEPRGWS